MRCRSLFTSLLAGAAALAFVPGPALAQGVTAAGSGVTTIAVIGDTPYGADQSSSTAFPNLVNAVNADPNVSMTVHLGDIKNGSTACSDPYFDKIKGWFNNFDDPLVYTPGDNEWTDCHRTNNGSFNPLERLGRIRQVFFPFAGQPTAGTRSLETQASQPGSEVFKENNRWQDCQSVFATVHVVGSNNGRQPWTGQSGATPEQQAEVDARTAAADAWINQAFDRASAINAPGVVLMMQADMWDASAGASGLSGFDSIVATIADRSVSFAKPVLILQGDSHTYKVDNPYTDPTEAALHPAPATVPTNVTRVVVQGQGTSEYLRLTCNPLAANPFSFQRVSVAAPPPVVPEIPAPVLLPVTAGGMLAGVALLRRRRRSAPVAR